EEPTKQAPPMHRSAGSVAVQSTSAEQDLVQIALDGTDSQAADTADVVGVTQAALAPRPLQSSGPQEPGHGLHTHDNPRPQSESTSQTWSQWVSLSGSAACELQPIAVAIPTRPAASVASSAFIDSPLRVRLRSPSAPSTRSHPSVPPAPGSRRCSR